MDFKEASKCIVDVKHMSRVGRPQAKDPVVSKPVSLKTSTWELIEDRNQSRASFFRHMIEDWDDLRDFDIRKMSFNRAYVIIMNRMQSIDDVLYIRMLALYENLIQGRKFE